VTGAGLLVKQQFVAMALVAALVLVVSMATDERRRWPSYLLGFGVPAALGSVWWVRNLVRFQSLAPPGGEILQPVRAGPWNAVGPIRYAVDHVGDLVDRFWGLYGQSAVETPPGWRAGLGIAALGLTGLWLVARRWRRPRLGEARIALLALFPLALAAGALQASYGVFHRNGEPRGLLGRYLYAAVPVLAIGAVGALRAGFSRLPRRWRQGDVLLAAGTVVAGGLGLAGFTRAMHGLYGTTDLELLLRRARVVSAVAPVGWWLLGLGVAWLGALGTAVVLSIGRRDDVPRAPSAPRSTD
jgi:hypothetical protein